MRGWCTVPRIVSGYAPSLVSGLTALVALSHGGERGKNNLTTKNTLVLRCARRRASKDEGF